jgi:hypothetical protein
MTEAAVPRLTARLFTMDGITVEVPDVPLPPPASSGKIRVEIPYPATEPARGVHRVAVINTGTGFIARASMYPVNMRPGDTLTVEFGADNVSGYRSLFGQDPTEAPGDSRLDAVAANLASLNEIIAEMTARVSDDPEFTAMTRELLRGHSHALGFQFQGDGGSC